MATKQPEQLSAAATPEPPNGGLAAWAGVFASFRLSAPSRIAWVGTIQAFCLVSTGVIAGPLFDRGYLHHRMIAGCFLTTLGLMMLSLSTEYYQIFLSQGIYSGLGSGLIYVPALSLVSTFFTTRRGLAAPLRQIIHWHAMKEWHFNAYGIANFLIFMAYFIPIFYVPTFAQTALHASTALSFYMVLILNAGSAIGRIGSSLLTYCLGASHILLVSVIASAVLLFGWTGIHSAASFVVFCVFFGIFSGVLISANPRAIAHPIVSPTLGHWHPHGHAVVCYQSRRADRSTNWGNPRRPRRKRWLFRAAAVQCSGDDCGCSLSTGPDDGDLAI
ncbi:hypothetical protein ANOM_011109 [Aspergillus nomiae NRRL 13137]|uniref:Monocarboxylate permease n=1 Tax=Aspergillus nomiae NRRL (strain ATCC 15546 / NRRL 13137 / CBS 260.88 / M93) TaxID=1509407 RepID=A0A0L1IN94_ASPN3|nr:uncharacterized protein ANOM_011109 [Aspergillus nomiae NRRL 13137]KNG80952.1 hypothetical protein ANOM_011109 [Aspergillus nomiae NRRL 13137]